MKWIGITGSWRYHVKEFEDDVRKSVTAIFNEGNGIVSGGAWGVDYIATDEALKHNTTADRIKIIIPSTLETYTEYYNRRVQNGRISQENRDLLFAQLARIASTNPSSLIELDAEHVYRKTFWARNTAIVEASDEVRAYQVNKSTGTQNTVNAAKKLRKPVTVTSYIAESIPA